MNFYMMELKVVHGSILHHPTRPNLPNQPSEPAYLKFKTLEPIQLNFRLYSVPQHILEPPTDSGYLCSDPISNY